MGEKREGELYWNIYIYIYIYYFNEQNRKIKIEMLGVL